jgi:hypothetical protein
MCQTRRQRAKLRGVDLALGDLVISCEAENHPLLGDAFIICDVAGEPLTAMSALDFDRPSELPIIAEPARLPPGGGALLLNFIAERARAAGIPSLRYAGPYPTPALFAALARSFRTAGSEVEFCANVLDRALRLARDPIAVDFAPAPHARVPFARGYCEVRDGVERAVIDGLGYERRDPYRTLAEGRAEVYFGAPRYAHVATFAATGHLAGHLAGDLIEGPHPLPRFADPIVGTAFDAATKAALGELLEDYVPGPLAGIAKRMVSTRELVYADLGARTAIRTPTGFALHGALWTHNRADLMTFIMSIAGALHPVVTQTIIAELQPVLPA